MSEELIDKIITYNYNEFGNEFGDCIVDMKNEIERLNKQIEEYQKALDETTSKKIDIENIIKEVRELLQKANIYRNYDDDEDDTRYTDLNIDEALEILDKEEK